MLYPQHFIDDLKDRADIVRLIEPYAELKKKGSNWMGCCPFHQEKTPSFSVSASKGFYKCFGCGKGGNCYTFLMEIEGLSFPEAIKKVAEVSGVPLPEPVDDENFQRNKKKREAKKKIADEVIELNKYALEFWEKYLHDDNQESRAAREYLKKRDISIEIQKTFRIGFAPESWDTILNLLKEKGADENLIEQSGLVSINKEKKKIYDRFRGRIMFPVLDINGNPIAFGARILAQGEPKYLNSPETPAYIKGEHLYGLFQNKDEIRKRKFSILVEGYLDLIALYQFGVQNAAASLGTAFTPAQAKLLGRFSKQVVVNYDGDSAGIKAARRAIETLIDADFDIKVLVLPDGKDPDDFIRENGAENYNLARGKSITYLQFVLEQIAKEYNIASPRGKSEAIEDILPLLSLIPKKIEKKVSIKQTLNFLHINDKLLENYLWKEVETRKIPTTIEKDSNYENNQKIKNFVAKRSGLKTTVAEQQLLELLIYDKDLRETILPQIEETDYEPLATAEVFRALIKITNDGFDVTSELLLKMTEDDPAASDFVPVLLMSEPAREKDEAIDAVLLKAENCVLSLRTMAIERRILDISQELAFAEQNGDFDLRDLLVVEQIGLARLKHELKNRISED